MTDPIQSPSNPRIKNIIKLQSGSKERRKQNLFVIEGFREISRAMAAGIEVKELYVCKELDTPHRSDELLRQYGSMDVFEVGIAAFNRIAYREGSDGLIALAVPRYLSLDDIKLRSTPLILVIESVEKPGNLGAIMRTADAARVDAVIVCDPLTDIYNPNAIRSGVGCVFTRQVVTCTSGEAINWLRNQKIKIFAAALSEKALIYHQVDFRGPSAIIMGTEATGLSADWLDKSDNLIIIPNERDCRFAECINFSSSTCFRSFEAEGAGLVVRVRLKVTLGLLAWPSARN